MRVAQERFELAALQRRIEEPLADVELAEVPCALPEFGRDAVSPQGQTACRITIQVSIRSLDYVEVRIDGAEIGGRRNHPRRRRLAA